MTHETQFRIANPRDTERPGQFNSKSARIAIHTDNSEIVVIHVPWEQPLSNEQKIIATEELSKLKPFIEAGQIGPLYSTLGWFKFFELLPPDWLYDAIFTVLDNEVSRHGRELAKGRQYEIDLIRWATVKHYREEMRLSWERAYAAASCKLRGSPAGGSEETIRASYKRHQHDGFVELLRQREDADAAVRTYARDAYEDLQKRLNALGSAKT